MSARPAFALLPPEELDLLISRSLDGDLPPEEQEELERYLTTDADARRRRDAIAALVGRVRDLPVPEPPFALATRVNAQVAERAQGLASAWNRMGIYPPPGLVPVLAFVVVGSLLGYALFGGKKPVPRPAAAPPAAVPAPDSQGPVRVFFQDAPGSRRWSVDVLGEKPAWKLTSVPVTRPEAAVDATYRLTLDGSGRVTSLRPVAAGMNVRPDVAQLLRGLVFAGTGVPDAPREVDVRIVAR